MIGGLVVQVGDDLYDASVRSRLEKLRRSLIERKSEEIQGRRSEIDRLRRDVRKECEGNPGRGNDDGDD